MIAQSTIIHCWWLAVYLLLGIWACSADSNPIVRPVETNKIRQFMSPHQGPSDEMADREIRLCGPELASWLIETCAVFVGTFDKVQSSDDSAHKAADECCKKACSVRTLHGFCKQIRSPSPSQSSKATGKHQEATSSSSGPTTMEPIIATPTDPTSRPEFAFAGELWDQEPLTLLPTYTSPDYTMNVMQRL